MLFPALIDLKMGSNDWEIFIIISILTFILASLIIAATNNVKKKFSTFLGFLLTNLLWITACILGALPLYYSHLSISFAQAVFESISGITSTGSTVLVGLDNMSHGILLWRSLLCWIGGIGFIALALLLLPSLRIGGIRLFLMESSDKSDKFLPRINQIAISITIAYLSLTVICILCFFIAGMSLFDSINHAFTTLATAGFSTHDSSFGFFKEKPLTFIVATIFMVLASLPFSVYIKAFLFRRNQESIDVQAKFFLWIVIISSLILAIYLCVSKNYSFKEAFITSAFHFSSIITTTGYTAEDYSLWGTFAYGIFFIISFIGGCSGSTAGGIKINRLIILWKIFMLKLKKLISPNIVLKINYNCKTLSNDTLHAVLLFICLYMVSIIIGTTLLIVLDLDFVSSFTGSLTALSNIGPGFGKIIGPIGNFSTISDGQLWVLNFLMLAGRLEIFTVVILFLPDFWRR